MFDFWSLFNNRNKRKRYSESCIDYSSKSFNKIKLSWNALLDNQNNKVIKLQSFIF